MDKNMGIMTLIYCKLNWIMCTKRKTRTCWLNENDCFRIYGKRNSTIHKFRKCSLFRVKNLIPQIQSSRFSDSKFCHTLRNILQMHTDYINNDSSRFKWPSLRNILYVSHKPQLYNVKTPLHF